MQSGELNQAVEMLRGAARQHPEDYFAQYWYAVALLHAGAVPGTPQGEEVLASLQASVRDNPSFWHSRAELGKALLGRGDVDAAIVHLTRANELNPKATSPLYLLAQCYRRKGDNAKAAELAAKLRSEAGRIPAKGYLPRSDAAIRKKGGRYGRKFVSLRLPTRLVQRYQSNPASICMYASRNR